MATARTVEPTGAATACSAVVRAPTVVVTPCRRPGGEEEEGSRNAWLIASRRPRHRRRERRGGKAMTARVKEEGRAMGGRWGGVVDGGCETGLGACVWAGCWVLADCAGSPRPSGAPRSLCWCCCIGGRCDVRGIDRRLLPRMSAVLRLLACTGGIGAGLREKRNRWRRCVACRLCVDGCVLEGQRVRQSIAVVRAHRSCKTE